MYKRVTESSDVMSILIIAEKPSAAQSIANAIMKKPIKKDGFLYEGQITITWAIGHLLTLAEPEQYEARHKKWDLTILPIIPTSFKLVPNPKTKKQLQIIKELSQNSSIIINACDSGREGELIFGYIMQYLKLNKPVKRLWTSSLTPEAIRNAYEQMKSGEDYRNLLLAAKARSESDWIIGINGTRAFTTKHDELLSVGRVQTPVLAMLANRQKEIENFKTETYFEVKAQFTQNSTAYIGTWQGNRITNKEFADKIVDKVTGKTGEIVSYDVKLKKEFAPKLYDLTLLQREASQRYGFSAKKTLDLAQSLYEVHKAITYPRTNSNYVDETVIPQMHKVYKALANTRFADLMDGGQANLVHRNNKNICRPDKIEDHHAILPTEKIPASLARDEERLYNLIVKRFASQFFPPAQFNVHTLITKITEESFKSIIKETLELGWKVIYSKDEKTKEEHIDEEELETSFVIDPAKPVKCKSAKTVQKETSPPKWFTEGTLVSAMQTAGREIEDDELREAMKDHGIGTPATRASIIERLKKVGYIQTQGKKLLVTPKGFALIEIVINSGVSLLTSPEMTGEWEKRLNEITRGIASVEQFSDQIKRLAQHIVEQVKKQGKVSIQVEEKNNLTASIPCPNVNCSGNIIEGKKGYGCTNWKNGCKFTIWKIQYGKKLSSKNISDLIKTGKTAFLKFKSKTNRPFEARLLLKDRNTGETALEFKNDKALTP